MVTRLRRHGFAALLWATTIGVVGFYLRLIWEVWLGQHKQRTHHLSAMTGPQPHVTIIVPARNEQRNIRRCVTSLLGQQYPDFDVVVVDDDSTDATPTILTELRQGPGGERLQIIQAGALPPGWAGKPHAMAVGAEVATGSWLLFTDADTMHHPEALAWAVREATQRNADLLSALPQLELADCANHIIMPMAVMGITAQYPPAQVANPKRATVIANGQFLFIRRAVYDAIGGYAAPALRQSVIDDRDMALAVKQRGGQVVLLDGREYVSVWMYRSFGEAWRGWSKNAYAGSRGGPLLFALMALALPIGTILPFVLALVGIVSRRKRLALLGSLQVAAIMAYRWQTDTLLRHARWWGWTHPVGGAIFTGLLWQVARRQITGRGVEWSGRTYQVQQRGVGAPPKRSSDGAMPEGAHHPPQN
jgi:chlorobactene glucosyltransferase